MGSDRDQLLALPSVRFGGGVLALFVMTAVCVRLGSGVGTTEAVLGLLCVLAGVVVPGRLVVPLGLVAWALVTGFLVNVGGQLTFDRADLVRAAVLLTVAAAGSLLRPRRPAQRGTRTSDRPGTQVIRSSRPGPIESPSS